MRSKRGGMIAEAAIIFPVVILSMMAILWILIRMYIDASGVIHEHLALRLEAGFRTETVLREEGYYALAPEDRFGASAFSRAPEIYDAGKYAGNYIFTDKGRCYIIDEIDSIRKVDLLQRGLGGV